MTCGPHATRSLPRLVGALLVACGLGLALPAAADPGTNDVGACLDSGQVWLLAVDAGGVVLSNQCVGLPGSGEEALRTGGLRIEKARNQVICSLGGVPEECPRTYRGHYWHYYHAAAGSAYTYSELGASARTPPPGSIEAWCYNAEPHVRCTPPALSTVVDGVDLNTDPDAVTLPTTSHEPAEADAGSPVALLATVALLAAGGLAAAVRTLVRGRSARGDGQPRRR